LLGVLKESFRFMTHVFVVMYDTSPNRERMTGDSVHKKITQDPQPLHVQIELARSFLEKRIYVHPHIRIVERSRRAI